MSNIQQVTQGTPLPIRMTNDLLFKRLLQDNPESRQHIISSLLHMDPSQIISTEVINSIHHGDVIDDKTVILDVNVVMNNSVNINLEMQVINYKDWPERSLIYAGRNLDTLKSGDPYIRVTPSIQIGFLDFQLFEDYPKFFSLNQMMDINDHHLYTDKLTIGVVDLTNIDLATDEDKRYNVDKWAKFFKAKTWEELEMITLEYPEISDSASYVHEISAEEHFRQQCAAREDAIRRENTLKFGLEAANKKLAEQDEIMAEQVKTIAERDETIAERDEEIARLKAELAKSQM